MPKVSEVHLRSLPAHSSEMVSQVVLGTPLLITGVDGEWVRVTGPDGYEGWVNSSSLNTIDDNEMKRWRGSDRVVVTSHEPLAVIADTLSYGDRTALLTMLVNGSIVEGKKAPSRGWTNVMLPGNVEGWIPSSKIDDFSEWSRQDFDSEKIIDLAASLTGDPYLWGGTTTKGVDCSGLVRVAFFGNAMLLPRDASQQALIGTPHDLSSYKPVEADLLFFANDEGRIVHVALYEKDDFILHSSGYVRRNSLNPGDALYLDRSVHHVIDIREALENGNIKKISNHSWYFNLDE